MTEEQRQELRATKVVEVLEAAKELVEQGWVQFSDCHTSADGHRCYCARGAIFSAASRWAIALEVEDAACCAFEEVVGSNITQWNDDPDRTREEVVWALGVAAFRVAKKNELSKKKE